MGEGEFPVTGAPSRGGQTVTMGVFGDTLKQARNAKGLTYREVELGTRINRHHLQALEEEDFAVLPPLIYQRGIVRNYATYIDLDPGKTLAMYEEARGSDAASELVASVKPLDMPRHWSPNFAIIAFMVVMGAVVFAWVYSISFSPQPAASTVPPAIPTVTPIPEDRLALPSPTAMPTATVVSATATSQPTTAAQVIPTVTPVPGVAVAQVVPTQPVAPPPAQPVVQPPTGATATIRVVAQGDIEVTVEADGVVIYSGWLGAGSSTDWMTASNFAVTTSNGGLTLFENANSGAQFYMGYGAYETYYLGG
jgi:cytoskeleton protein RodZ